MKRTVHILSYLILVGGLTGIASGQVATGIPAFSSIGGGPFDSVNLGNLNVHFSIPVIQKSGRGMPFSYVLTYDSSIWLPKNSSGQSVWTPVFNWGWSAQTAAVTKTGNISSSFAIITCDSGQVFVYSNWVYRDAWGTAHRYAGRIGYNPNKCPGVYQSSLTASATDGSGLTLTASFNGGGGLNQPTITTSGGTVLTPPVNLTSGSQQFATKATDANGNQITSDGNGHFYDTLSSTTPILTLAGGGTPSSPNTFTYTPPSGTNVSYTMNYVQYTVATAFGVSGITDYGRQSNALASSIQLPDGSSYTFTYEKTPGSCTTLPNTFSSYCTTGRIATVSLPTGGTTTYTYSGGANGIESDGSTAGLTRVLSPATSCSVGGCWQYSRSLAGSTWSTTVTDPTGNQTIINFTKDSSTSNPTYNFYETQRQIKQLISGTQTLLATVLKCYNNTYASCATATVSSPITQTDFYSQLPNGSTRLTETLYNSNGLVTDAKDYDYGVVTNAAPGTGHLIRETVTSYASLGNGIVNRPSNITVYDWTSGSKVTLAETTSSYDQGTPTSTTSPQHISISGSRGNLTTLTKYTSASATLSSSFTYYDTGNVNVATDVNGAQTTYVYGSGSCGNSFPTTIQEPLSLSRSVSYDTNCTGGVPVTVADENSNSTSTTYDDPYYWRPSSAQDALGNSTTFYYQPNPTYPSPAEVASWMIFNSGNSVASNFQYKDGFGRTYTSQQWESPNSSNLDTVSYSYDPLGRIYTVSLPCVASYTGTCPTAAKTYTYDALNRPLKITNADGGTVSYTYTNNDVMQKVSGSQTFAKQFEYDGLGRLKSVCEMTQATGSGTCGQSNQVNGYWTKYTYDALGRLLTVAQNAQSSPTQTRSFSFDWLSRVTSESNPETGNNGVNGTATYIYDTADATCSSYSSKGDLVEKKDAAGNVSCSQYDALHRATFVSYPQGPNASVTPAKYFQYDTEYYGSAGTNIKGRLVAAVTCQTNTSCAGSSPTGVEFGYSPRGELTDVWEWMPHSNGTYHITASYWANGTLNQLSGIPSVPATIYGWYGGAGPGLDGEGRITRVAVSGPYPDLIPFQGVAYNTAGQTTNVTLGSGDSDNFSYDPNTGRLKTYSFNVNGNTDMGTLTWNTNGTLASLAINDQIPGTADSQSCTYGYDDLRRVSGVSCGSLWSQTFNYDAFGNISKSGSITFLPSYTFSNGANTNQFFSLPGNSVSYDANGNLLQDNLNTYAWDAAGKMLSVSNGSTAVNATYDALGRMVETYNGSTYTELIYGPTGTKVATANGQTLIKAFIALPGGAKAIYNSSGLAYFRHSDWLGSSRLASTATAPTSVYSSSAYAPFGEQYATTGNQDASFTGQDQDTINNLYDFPARRYSPSQGRWISPDPLGIGAVTLTKPQSWNRYAYVLNNPLSLIDSMGYCGDDDDSSAGDDDSGGGDGGGGGGDDDDDDGMRDYARRGGRAHVHRGRAMDCGNGDDDDSSCDASACVTAPPPDSNPCVIVGAGVGDNTDDPSFDLSSGFDTVFPYDASVVGGGGGFSPGIASVSYQATFGANSSTQELAGEINSVAPMNSNTILVLFSGSAQAFSTAVNSGMISQDAMNNITGIIYVSPGAPGGFADTPGIPTAVFQSTGTGVLDPGVAAGNGFGALANGNSLAYPAIPQDIPGCGHAFDCEGTGSNGVLNGIDSDCNYGQDSSLKPPDEIYREDDDGKILWDSDPVAELKTGLYYEM